VHTASSLHAEIAPKTGLLTLLQLLCAIGLALGVVIFLPVPLRALSGDPRKLALLFGAGYLICAFLLLWRERRGDYVGFDSLLSSLVVGLAPALLFALHIHSSVPTRLIVAEVLWGGVLATVTVALQQFPRTRAALLAISAVVGLVLPLTAGPKPQVAPAARHWRLNSALYALKVTEYSALVPESTATGGAIAPLRDKFVVANGIGEMVLVSKTAGSGVLTSQHLSQPVPINWHDFERTFGEQEDLTYFRTADLLTQDLGDKVRLFATHHYWKTDQKCFVVRVSMLEVDTDRLLRADVGDTSWKTIFESTPCIHLDSLEHFGGIQIGGRLALLSPTQLLVAVGDHEHDGVNSPELFPQDNGTSYGKTILINLADFSTRQFSMGHRNPQGLFIDGPDAIWLTEHGPQGGDELNLIQRGANYGWPLASYGTQYGAHFWPGDAVPGSHSGYTEPFYSWVPSIGVSSLLVVHGEQFKLWDRDLVVASLREGALFRARVRNARIVMLERIPFARRIRDIAQGSQGQLILWSDKGAVLEVQADHEVGGGETVFQACNGCHVIGDGISNGIGPDLRKVVNRPVAATAGYRYSAALSNLGGKWTRERLDQFLTNPQAYAPGTKMKFPGITNTDDRKQLIEFLASGANNNPPPEDEVTE
jgi:cytochrome c2